MKTAAPKAIEIPAGEFKAKCLHLLDEVRDTGKRIVITKRGVPVADVVPHQMPEKKPFRSVFGLTPEIKIKGDIVNLTMPEWVPNMGWD